MPIFDQGYQHWGGELSGHAWRWLTITRQGFRAQRRNIFARLVLILGWLPGIGLAFALAVWSLIERKSPLVEPIVSILSPMFKVLAQDPVANRSTVWTICYLYYFSIQKYFALILVIIIGPNLISQDLRFNALPLYFSRPLWRTDYFLGKFGVIAVFVGAVMIVPALLAYLVGFVFSLDFSLLKDTSRLLLGIIGYGAVFVLSAGMLMLGFSALSRNSRYVAAMFAGLWLVSWGSGALLTQALGYRYVVEEFQGGRYGRRERVENSWTHLVSYMSNLERIADALLDSETAWRNVAKFTDQMQQSYGGARMRVPVSSRKGMPLGRSPGPRPEDTWPLSSIPNYPWSWSAGVLAGLLGISLWILTFRVKSLDRLR